MLMCTCPECGGDGVETCNNPDHGFGYAAGLFGPHGCPGCIRGNPKNPKFKCGSCNGTGRVDIDLAADYLGVELEEFLLEHDLDAHAEWSVSR